MQLAVYPVTIEPPLPDDAVNVTLMLALPCMYDCAGSVGTVAGTVAVDGRLWAELPSAFVAKNLAVYDLPFVSPVTTSGEEAPLSDPARPRVDRRAGRCVAGDRASVIIGATNATEICALPAVAWA